jgi:hypothetical protein
MTRTSTVLTSVLSDALIAGLDPAIHRIELPLRISMDARVEPAHDDP